MGHAKSTYSLRKGQVVHRASSPKGGTGEAVSPTCPPGQEGPGSPSPWHWPACWGCRAANSEHLSPGQTWPPPSRTNLSAPGRRACYRQPEGLRGAGTLLQGDLRNQWVENPALNIPGCPHLLDLPSKVQTFNFDLHGTFGAIQLRIFFFLWTGLDQGAVLEPETKTSPEAEDLIIFLS